MAGTVFANGRGVAHETSGGTSIVFPDVCNTPSAAGPIPLPYPNIGRSADTDNGTRKVQIDGSSAMIDGAQYRSTSGDEAGTAGGVISGVNRGPAEFMLYSFDVRIEGKGVCRMGDPLFHNRKNIMG
ncbi:hypothetical protein A7982_12119 [Minicystis rosea]|nr:hypothetical protein A7982_12119 [Minicystis rosea]